MQYNGYGYPGYPMSSTEDIMGVPRVSSIEEVRAASVFGQRQMFMENDRQVFYIKGSNGDIRCFKFDEVPLPTPESYVTREEFNDLRSKYEQLVQSTAAANAANATASATPEPQPNAADANGPELQWNPGVSQAAVLPDGGAVGYDAQPVGQVA